MFFYVYYDIFVNEEIGVLGIVMGMGIVCVLVVIMLFGLDFCFDLIYVYWLVVGIVGIDF